MPPPRRPFTALCTALLLLATQVLAQTPAPTTPTSPTNPTSIPTRLAPTRSLQLELQGMIRLFEEVHFNRDRVTPATYAEVIPETFKAYDGQHLFFLASDLAEFQARHPAESLYWNLATLGRLDIAFAIFERYAERVRSRVAWVQKRLLDDFDFTTNRVYLLDRAKVSWPADAAEADEFWEDRLRFELLAELLNDKTLDEARAKVARRYERILKNLDDYGPDDVAEIFLTAIASLYDPHSTYFSPDTYEEFGIGIRLQLHGIGALLGMEEDVCVIKEIIPGGPADLSRALKPNDKIFAVAQGDGEFIEVVGLKLRRIVQMIRGEKGTRVRLLIQPADAADSATRREITLTRDLINLDSARAHGAIFELPAHPDGGPAHRYGVVTLPTFYGRDNRDAKEQNSATDDVARLIRDFKTAGIDGLVLDLRRNGGGLLSEAVSLTGLFIPSGPVVQIKNHAGEVKIDEDRDPGVLYDGPLVVLTSRFSASASEIVAGALQNYGRAVVVGDPSTHGKGTVQTVIEMGNVVPQLARRGTKAGAAKITVQKFYLPDGASTQQRGVHPDIVLPSLEQHLPVGEQDLARALPWDEISTSFYPGAPLPTALLDTLRSQSKRRVAELAEFDLLRRSIDRFVARQAEKSVSLNLATRREGKKEDRRFREELDQARKRLEADTSFPFTEFFVAPPPPPRIRAATDAREDTDGEPAATDEEPEEDRGRYARLDVHLRESLRILDDLRRLATPSAAPAPAAVASARP